MSTGIMLPITLATAGACGLLQFALGALVIVRRASTGVIFGVGTDDDLLRRVRAHANLSEYLPAVLLLLALLELSGAWAAGLGLAAGAFVLGRCIHAYGLIALRAMWARQVGMSATLLVLSGLACWGLVKALGQWV